MALTERQKALLAVVIERYVENAEPVGSATLAHDAKFAAQYGVVSSATIRNELAELESEGFLAHPHTSAGRVPTDAGYRIYVNEMLRPRPLKAAERSHIRTQIAAPASSIEDALRDATAALARLTGYPAIASLPATSRDTMRQVQLNAVPPRRFVLVLVTGSGRIENRLFEVSEEVPAHRVTTVVNFLNEQLGGRPLSQLRALPFEDVATGLHDTPTVALARSAWEQLCHSVADLSDERIVVQGVITLLDEPEFSEIGQARAAMRLFDDTATLGDLLQSAIQEAAEMRRADATRRAEATSHAIVIGREHPRIEHPAVELFSFVGVAYCAGGETLGSVGVMGPTRMKYAEAISLLPALTARLQSSLESL